MKQKGTCDNGYAIHRGTHLKKISCVNWRPIDIPHEFIDHPDFEGSKVHAPDCAACAETFPSKSVEKRIKAQRGGGQ